MTTLFLLSEYLADLKISSKRLCWNLYVRMRFPCVPYLEDVGSCPRGFQGPHGLVVIRFGPRFIRHSAALAERWPRLASLETNHTPSCCVRTRTVLHVSCMELSKKECTGFADSLFDIFHISMGVMFYYKRNYVVT